MTSDPHADLRDAVRQICAKFPDEYWRHCDEAHEFPWDFYRAFADGGWVGIAIPEEYGGGGAGITEASILLEEIAASGACLNGCSAIHLSVFGMNPVVHHGSEAMKATYLPQVAAGDLHVSFGVTEPDAGTDTTNISTWATPVDGGWRIRGRKIWNTKAHIAAKCLLLARTTPLAEVTKRTDGMTLFLADMQVPDVDIVPIPKLGRNAVASCEVSFDDLFVADSDVVGEVGRGFHHLLDGLNPERILLAGEALGIGRAAIRRAVDYANERIVFGRPIGKNQGIAFPTRRRPHAVAGGGTGDPRRECPLRRRPPVRRAGEQCQVPRRRGGVGRRRPGGADPRRHGIRQRVRRRALLARGATHSHCTDLPGDGPQLHRRARPRPPAVVLRIPRRRPPSRYLPAPSGLGSGPTSPPSVAPRRALGVAAPCPAVATTTPTAPTPDQPSTQPARRSRLPPDIG